MKAAIYNRRSLDKEDSQVLSIDGQRDANDERLTKSGDQYVGTYEESGSAKKPGKRSEFQRLMNDVRSGEIEVVYCWKLNRLARNPVDGGEVQWLLQEGILKAIDTSERRYLPSDNVLQMAVELGMATQFSRDLAKDVKRGMKQKAEMGWKPGPAHIGYLNTFGIKGERTIVVDSEQFEIVRRCWDELLVKRTPVNEIHRIATDDWGLAKAINKGRERKPIVLSAMYNIFTQPFYYGEFAWDGEVYQGAHTPMINKDEFDRSQEILGSKGKPRKEKHSNIYAGMIRCGECDSAVVLDIKTKHIKSLGIDRKYLYHRCGKKTKCSQKGCIKEEELSEQMRSFVRQAVVPRAFIDWALLHLQLSQKENMKNRKKSLKGLQIEYKNVASKIDVLVDRQLSPTTCLPEAMFQEKLKQLEIEKVKKYELSQDFDASAKQSVEDVVDALSFMSKLAEKFENGSDEDKVGILGRIGLSVELRDKQLKMQYREPFATFINGNNQLKEEAIQIEPSMALAEVPKAQLQDAVTIWYPGEDSNL